MTVEEQLKERLNRDFTSMKSLNDTIDGQLISKQNDLIRIRNQTQKVLEENPRKVQAIFQQAKKLRTTAESIQSTRSELLRELEKRVGSLNEDYFTGKDLRTGYAGSSKSPNNLLYFLSEKRSHLQRLEQARAYFLVFLRVNELSTEIQNLTPTSADSLLSSYDELRVFASALHNGSNTEDILDPKSTEAVTILYRNIDNLENLSDYINNVTEQAYQELKKEFGRRLSETLASLKWPSPIDRRIGDPILLPFITAFKDLLRLEATPLNWAGRGPPNVERDQANEKDSELLLPFEVMVEVPGLRFQYHFSGNRPTNRLDKPEWMFKHILSVIEEHTSFLCGAVQDILDNQGLHRYDAKNFFVEGLLDIVMKKLASTADQLLEDPQLLSHAVSETLLFDKTLREDHFYHLAGESPDEWPGCVSVFLDNKSWFDSWLLMERTAAMERFQQILDLPDGWELAYANMTDIDDMKTVKSVEMFVTLLEAITDRYRLLPGFKHKLAFFSEIQLSLLGDYVQHINDNVNRRASKFNPVQMVKSSIQDKVDRALIFSRYLSALNYLSSILREWDEQPFFLDMWQYLLSKSEESDEPSERLFGDVIMACDKQRAKIEGLLIEDYQQQFVESLWQYDKKRTWSKMERSDLDLTVSTELLTTIGDLKVLIDTLGQNLPRNLFQPLLRKIASEIDEHLFNRIVCRNQFTHAGARQLSFDMKQGFWGGVFVFWHKKPENLFQRMRDVCVLLTLPERQTNSGSPPSSSSELSEHTSPNWSMVVMTVNGHDPDEASALLKRIGVGRLDLKQVLDVLSRRVDL